MNAVAPPWPSQAPELVPIPCTRCGASMDQDGSLALHVAPVARCRFCGGSETLPPEQGERIRFLRLRLMQLRRAAEGIEAPAKQLDQIRKTWGSYVPFILVIGLVPLVNGSSSLGWAVDQAAKTKDAAAIVGLIGNLLPMILPAAVPIGILAGYLAMMRAFDRAVRPMLRARPPLTPDGRARCRTCGGELTVTPAVSVTCSYCQATNLLGPELTTKRAELLAQEANAYRARAQAFGRAMSTPYKAPAHVFYIAAALTALATLIAGEVAGITLALLR